MTAAPTKGKMPGRLSVFQRIMLLWNQGHPYNAVHVARVAAPLDAARLSQAVNSAIEASGLTGLEVDPGRRRFVYRGGPANIAVKAIDGAGEPLVAVSSEVREQINSPFPIDGAFTPFKFFTVADGDAFYLGVVYCHFISDADPIIALFTGIIRRYTGSPAAPAPVSVPSDAPNLYAGAGRHVLAAALRHVPRWLSSVPAAIVEGTRACKPHYARKADQTNGFTHFAVPPEEFEALKFSAKSWGVTLNDVFLCALIKAVSPLAEGRIKGARRNRVSVCSIASIRKDLPDGGAGKMGPFLGSFSISQSLPDGKPLAHIVGGVHRQTLAIKKAKLYMRTLFAGGLALSILRRFPVERQQKLYQQNYPLWGGISSFNMNSVSRDCAQMTDYLRAVSTGPACPLVLSITTYNGTLNVGVSYRTTVFSDDDILRIIAGFRHTLENPEG